jgi:hypothetical protein
VAFRTILAVLLGFALTRALIAVTDALFGVKTPGTGYFALSFAMDTIACLLGGWLCAIISRNDVQAVIGLILFGEILAIGSTIFAWSQRSHLYSLCLLGMYPPAIWFGARLRKKLTA